MPRFSPCLVLLCLVVTWAAATPARAQCAPKGAAALDVRACGARDASQPAFAQHDSSAAIRSALAASKLIEIPAGTWLVSQIVIPTGTTIRTHGMSTVLRQLPASMPGKPGEANRDFPMILVQGSDVELGSFKAVGNSSLDRGEWNHAVSIASPAGSIARIRLGDVFGESLRGDVVMIDGGVGGRGNAGTVSQVSFGTITGHNVLRSMMSINGGTAIRGVAVGDAATGGHCGYRTLDLEPNHWNEAPDDVVIGAVVGGSLQLASADFPAKVVGTVTIGSVDLSSARQQRPVPDYVDGKTGSSYFDTSVGLIASGWHKLRIDELSIAGKSRAAIMAPLSSRPGDGVIELGRYQGSANATDPGSPYPEIFCAGCGRLRIEQGASSLPVPSGGATAKYFVSGGRDSAGTLTVLEIARFTLRGGGAFAATSAGGYFRNIVVTDSVETPTTAALFIDVSNSVIDKLQVGGARTLFFRGANNVVMRTDLAQPALRRGLAADHVVLGAADGAEPPPR
ncbi:MAG: hypothetical protein IT383_10195 [Deltaproteobacteria bacterium]|nr:hypothetical protein [Deltaproteobacteria bacterium]